jgi:hypothetical protein
MKKGFWVLSLAALMVFGLAMSASAAGAFKVGDTELKLGGSVRAAVGSHFTDYDATNTGSEDDNFDAFVDLFSTSNVNLAAKYGDLSGLIELGLNETSGSTAGNSYVRHAYVSYALDKNSSLLIGQTWSLLSQGVPCQRLNGDLLLKGFGNLDSNRYTQVRYTYTKDDISMSLALEDDKELLDMSTSATDLISDVLVEHTGAMMGTGNYRTNVYLPAILGSLTYKMDGDDVDVTLTPSFFFEWAKLADNTGADNDIDAIGLAGALNGSVAIKDDATIGFEAWMAKNAGLFANNITGAGTCGNGAFNDIVVDLSGDELDDVTSYGGWLQVAVPIDEVTVALGGGYQAVDTENFGGTEDSIETFGVFTNVKYEITKGLTMQPEVAYFDKGDNINGVSQGDEIYGGIVFQYDI